MTVTIALIVYWYLFEMTVVVTIQLVSILFADDALDMITPRDVMVSARSRAKFPHGDVYLSSVIRHVCESFSTRLGT